MRNLYEVLGVSKEATHEEIKKAYRQLARQHHPDRNPGDKDAETRFKEVQEAYDILGDKDKREQYDNPHQNINMGFGGPDFFNDFVNNVFNFRGQQTQQRQVEINSQLEIAIDFWEGVKGCDKTLTVPKFKTCEVCSGSGAAETEACSFCASKGVITQRQGFVTMQTTCPQCRGAGRKVKKGCEACKQNGSTRDDGTVLVQIPEGVSNGTVLKLEGQGNEHLGRVGDLYLVIRVNPHEVFKRNGDNLIYQMPITYSQAVLGATLMVPSLDGEVELVVPKGTKNQTAIIVKGKGFKNPATGKQGDLVVWVEIETINIDDVREDYKGLVEALSKWDGENESPGKKNFKRKAT